MGIFSVQDPSNGGSLFRTQANTQFNSFQNPVPTMNMGGPGWGIDQSYMTPSYAAPYRPGSSEESINSARPGFWASVHNQINPMASRGYGPYSDPFWGQQQYRESIYGKSSDAAMWTAQNIGVGAGAFMLANRITKGWAGKGAALGSDFMRGMAGGMFGGAATATNFGRIGVASSGLAGAAAGGLFGGLVAPMLIGQGIVNAADAAIFDPYVNQRQTARSLRENFSGITFGQGESGSSYWGRGLSFSASNQISSQVTREGFRNFGMTGKEISGISDMAARAGLLENVNPKDFAKQITSITKQIGIIAAVANDPDFRNSIEIMAKMKSAGANITQVGSILGQIGGHAGVAGISTKRMMELGRQGEFMYSANNLTPYVGGVNMAHGVASFGAAYRNGLISNALMARMGGVEGAAQALTTANINGVQTPYNQMMMASQYLGGVGRTGNISSDISNFGRMFGKDPLGVFGAMGLYGGRMASHQLANDPMALHDQVMSMAKSMNMTGAGGKLDAGKAFLLAQQITGDSKAAEAFIHDQLSYGDAKNVKNMIAGQKNAFTKDVATMMDAHGVSGTYLWAKGKTYAKRAGASVQDFVQSSKFGTNAWQESESKGIDAVSGLIDEFNYGPRAPASSGELKVSDLNSTKSWSNREDEMTFFDLFSGPDFLDNKGLAKRFAKISDRDNWQKAIKGTLRQAGGYWFGDSGPDSNREAIDKYFGTLTENKLTAEEMFGAISDVKGGKLDSQRLGRVKGAYKTKDIMAFASQFEELDKRRKAANPNQSLDDYIRSTGKSLKENIIALGGTVNGGIDSIAGNSRIDELGDSSLLEKYQDRQASLRKNLDEIQTKASKGMISGSQYTAQLNKYASETNMSAAELQYKAAELNWAAAKAEHSKEAKEIEAAAIKKSPAGGNFNQPGAVGR